MTTTTGSPEQQPHGASSTGASALRGALLYGAGTLLALCLLPLALMAGVPLAGWAIGAGAVVGNRLVGSLITWAVRDQSTAVILGAVGFSGFFRALFTALALFLVGAQVGAGGDQAIGLGRPDLALPAIIVFLVCYTLDAGIETIRRASQKANLELDTRLAPLETNA